MEGSGGKDYGEKKRGMEGKWGNGEERGKGGSWGNSALVVGLPH